MRISGVRIILMTTQGEVEVKLSQSIPPLELVQGELVTISMPIVLDENDQPFVPMPRLN